MDYEKLYKEALDNLNRIKNESPEWWREHEKTMQEIFPGFFETEDKRIKNGLVRLLNCIAMKEYEDTFCITKEEALEWVKRQGEQKPVNRLKTTAGNWYVCEMEVMNENMTTAFHRGEVYYCPKDGYIDVNGALFEVGTLDVFRLATKEEIQQQKQDWSEEDEKKIDFLRNLIRFQIKDSKFSYGWGDDVKYVTKEEAVDILTSLRPRSHWKPSKDQMFNLKCAADSNSNVLLGQSLLSLYNDLKKLIKE